MAERQLLLEAKSLGRRRPNGEGWLFRNVSLKIYTGQRLVLVGRSGAGKTLTLRALALLDPVDEGHVLWRGQTISAKKIPWFRSRVVYLHQRPDAVEGTVEQVLKQPFKLRVHADKRFSRERVISLLQTLGRDESFLGKSGQDLSGGEAQIVALLRALQFEPNVLLLDEPTSSLDSETTQLVETLLNRWVTQSAERAFVWVTHDLEQAQRVADDVLRIDAGQLTHACAE